MNQEAQAQAQALLPGVTPAPQSPTIPMADLNDFVRTLSGWHSNKVATLRHMMELPDGSEMLVDAGQATERTVVMTGDMLAGFREGIDLALMELGSLPFLVELEEGEEVTPA